MKKAILCIAVVCFGACSSSTLIKTAPEGAEVFIDGESVGVTPYRHSDIKLVYSKTRISLQKKGYKLVNGALCKNEKFNPVACIGILTLPFWYLGYEDQRIYNLEPDTEECFIPQPGE